MRLLTISVAMVGLAAAAWGTSRQSASKVATKLSTEPCAESCAGDETGEGLIVHEWGTFTSFSGSDGVRLEFRPLVDEDLPPFVLDRYLQSGVVNWLSKSQIRVRMRMETPVTYFYTQRERDVNVRVSLPDGLLTEFYPPVERMEPRYRLFEQAPLTHSSLDWGKIHLIPTDCLQANVADPARRRLLEALLPAGLTPSSEARFHYGHARETDSALVHIHRPQPDRETGPLAPAGDFFEKFLFYRGVGNFELPLKLTAASDGTFDLANSGRDPIRSLFLIDADGQSIRFAAYEQIAAGERLQLVQTETPATLDALADAVKESLVKEGLYEKEALAMVNTWRSSWFGEMGTRLLYVVPQPLTDALLPLDISPAPEKTVRVLVGRMEIMPPAEESRIEALVQKSAAERQAAFEQAASSGQPVELAALPELTSRNRFAEPALLRVSTISKDTAIRAEAKWLLKQITGTVSR